MNCVIRPFMQQSLPGRIPNFATRNHKSSIIFYIIYSYTLLPVVQCIFICSNLVGFEALLHLGADVNLKCFGTPSIHLVLGCTALPDGSEFGTKALTALLDLVDLTARVRHLLFVLGNHSYIFIDNFLCQLFLFRMIKTPQYSILQQSST